MVHGSTKMIIRFLIGLWILMNSIPTQACDFDYQIESMERKIRESRQVLDNNSLDNIEVVKRHLATMCIIDQEVRKLFIAFDNPITRKLLTEVAFQSLAKKRITKPGFLCSMLIMNLSFKNAVSCYCSNCIPVERQIRKTMRTSMIASP